MFFVLENFGIGIDIIEVNRFREKPFAKNKKFYKKIFRDSEIEYCLNHGDPSESFAAKFAIKESVIKAINNKIDLRNILTDIVNAKPTVLLQNDSSYNFLVSISHEKSFAIAVVISEKYQK